MSERPNHVIIQDVLQGTCALFLSCFCFSSYSGGSSRDLLDNTRPYSQITSEDESAICYKTLNVQRKRQISDLHYNTFMYPSLAFHDSWLLRIVLIFCGEYWHILLQYYKKIYFTHVWTEKKGEKKSKYKELFIFSQDYIC